jgi:hypothetical protein
MKIFQPFKCTEIFIQVRGIEVYWLLCRSISLFDPKIKTKIKFSHSICVGDRVGYEPLDYGSDGIRTVASLIEKLLPKL